MELKKEAKRHNRNWLSFVLIMAVFIVTLGVGYTAGCTDERFAAGLRAAESDFSNQVETAVQRAIKETAKRVEKESWEAAVDTCARFFGKNVVVESRWSKWHGFGTKPYWMHSFWIVGKDGKLLANGKLSKDK